MLYQIPGTKHAVNPTRISFVRVSEAPFPLGICLTMNGSDQFIAVPEDQDPAEIGAELVRLANQPNQALSTQVFSDDQVKALGREIGTRIAQALSEMAYSMFSPISGSPNFGKSVQKHLEYGFSAIAREVRAGLETLGSKAP